MAQTSYLLKQLVAYEGGRGDSRPATIHTGRNNSGAEMAYGRFVIFDSGSGTTELAMTVPSAAGQKVQGVLLHDMAHENQTTGLADDGVGSVISRGSVWMIAEGTVGPADNVYMRFAAAASPAASDAIGRVGKIRGGVAQVSTVTPGAAQDSTPFALRVSFSDRDYVFSTVSDGTMTATEVCNNLRTAMAADAAFTARVVATGSATLILTGQVAGEAFEVSNAGVGTVTIAATTAPAPTAELQPNARFLTTATIGLPVLVELNLP